MANAAKATADPVSGIDQLTKLNEKFTGVGKQVGNLYLDGYMKIVDSVTSAQTKLAAKSKNETLESAITTQVDLTRKIASTYTSAARELLA